MRIRQVLVTKIGIFLKSQMKKLKLMVKILKSWQNLNLSDFRSWPSLQTDLFLGSLLFCYLSFFSTQGCTIRIQNGLARRADSATQSQFSVHFSTKTSDFFRSEFCDILIRSGYEVVAKGPESVNLASPEVLIRPNMVGIKSDIFVLL